MRGVPVARRSVVGLPVGRIRESGGLRPAVPIGGQRHVADADRGRGREDPALDADGRSLVFGDASGLVEVTVETSPAFKASLPQRVLTWPDGVVSDFDISRDGTKFLAVKDVGDAAPGQLNVVLNWHEELKRLVPTR